jgi:hypothetical protein
MLHLRGATLCSQFKHLDIDSRSTTGTFGVKCTAMAICLEETYKRTLLPQGKVSLPVLSTPLIQAPFFPNFSPKLLILYYLLGGRRL